MQLELIKNPDIIADVAQLNPKPCVIGFAAETRNVEQYAKGKLETKKLDAIIANDVSNQDIGFNSDQNAVSIISSEKVTHIPQDTKSAIAATLICHISQLQASQ